MSSAAAATSAAAPSWWPSTVNRTSTVSGRVALWAPLPPAPSAGADHPRPVDEDHLPGHRVHGLSAAEVGEPFAAAGEADRGGSGDRGLIESRNRKPVTDRHQVGDVHQQVYRRDVPVLGEAAKQGLGRRAVSGGLHPEAGEHPTPGADGRRGRKGHSGQLGGGGPLLVPVFLPQGGRAGAVRQPHRMHHPGPNGRIPFDDPGVIGEHTRRRPLLSEAAYEGVGQGGGLAERFGDEVHDRDGQHVRQGGQQLGVDLVAEHRDR